MNFKELVKNFKKDDPKFPLILMAVMLLTLIIGIMLKSLFVAVISMILSVILIAFFIQQVITVVKEKQDDQQR